MPICSLWFSIADCLESIISSSHGQERSLSLKDKSRLSVQHSPGVIGHPWMTALNCRAMFAAFISQSNSVGVDEGVMRLAEFMV